MKVLCKASNMASDVRCSVCGQGFLVYWTHSSTVQRARQHAEVLQVLREHHAELGVHAAHPAREFYLPGDESDVQCVAEETAGIAA